MEIELSGFMSMDGCCLRSVERGTSRNSYIHTAVVVKRTIEK
jgi:hypothetical protein